MCWAVTAARRAGCLIQFEDFATDKAFAILEKFQDKFLCFNDDVRTGAPTFLRSLRATVACV